MEYVGKFKITVDGDPIKVSSAFSFKSQIHRGMIKIDTNVKLTERKFMEMTYSFIWEGTPKDMYALSRVWITLQRIISGYFTKWRYEIKIDLVEREGG